MIHPEIEPKKAARRITKEHLITLWMDTEPFARSPYAIYGYPDMWVTVTEGDMVLFSSPGKTMVKPNAFSPYEEVPGVRYQWQKDGEWVGQAYVATFKHFIQTMEDIRDASYAF